MYACVHGHVYVCICVCTYGILQCLKLNMQMAAPALGFCPKKHLWFSSKNWHPSLCNVQAHLLKTSPRYFFFRHISSGIYIRASNTNLHL